MPILGARGGASSRGLGQFTGSPTAPTSPVAGYHLWLDAANSGSFSYSSGSVVSQWTDRSANAFTFTTAGTTNQPARTGTQNSKSTVVFDGSDNYLKSTASATTWKYLHDGSGATIFLVIKSNETVPGVNGDNWVMSTQQFNSGISISAIGGTTPNKIQFNIADATAGTYLWNEQNQPSTGHNLYVAKLDPNNGTDANKLPMYINGGVAKAPTFVYNWSGASTADPDTSLYLGTGYDAVFADGSYPYYMFSGEIAEVITYQSLLSDSDRIANTNYLKAKWGL